MEISVFGATGFIGSTFCQIFHDRTVKIERSSRAAKSNEILYFISTTSNYNILEDSKIDVEVNLTVLMEVLEHCKDSNIIFNYVSTGFVYGNDIVDAKETDECHPSGFYSITKRTAELLIISFCETFGVKYRILRLANVYGTEDKDKSGKKNALGYLVNQLIENSDVNLYDGGDVLRDYLHVKDICRAIMLVIEKGEVNNIFNIASGKPMKFRDIIQIAKRLTKSTSNINSIKPPEFYEKVQAKNFSLNTDKLMNLGFKETISIEEGLQILCR